MQEESFKRAGLTPACPNRRAAAFFSRKNNFCLLFSVNELN
jgi:hypothetical protein